jgi:hypothetical protein
MTTYAKLDSYQASISGFVPRSLSHEAGSAGDRKEYYQYAVTVAGLSRSCSSPASKRDHQGHGRERS